jgi:tetratricopeptide (TPR) repeat protein
VGFNNLPLSAEYAYGGSRALQVWYRDTTLSWLPRRAVDGDSSVAATTFVEYQPPPWRSVVLIDPGALRAQREALVLAEAGRLEESIAAFDRSDSLQPDTAAVVFRGDNAGRRAGALLGLRRLDEAEREARTALRASPLDVGARFALVVCLAGRDRAQALAHLDTLEAQRPRNPEVRRLREILGRAADR